MLLSSFGLVTIGLLAPLCSANPALAEAFHPILRNTDLIVREPTSDHESYMLVRRDGRLEKRISTTFSLEQTLENEVLIDGSFFDPLISIPVTVSCKKCCTSGSIKASLTDDEIVNPTLRFDLAGVQAFIELDVIASGGHTFELPLFRLPPSPLGIDIPGGPKLGLTFEINLVFNFQASIDLSGGFFFKLPDNAFFEASLLDGTLSDINFAGIVSQSLPLTIHNENTNATFQVDLNLKAQVGIDLTSSIIPAFKDFGAQAVVGVFVNLIEFIAKLKPTATCALQADELIDLNIGAFLLADVQVADLTIGAVPTVSTTLFEAAIGTQCLVAVDAAFPIRTSALPTVATSACSIVKTNTTLGGTVSKSATATATATTYIAKAPLVPSVTVAPKPRFQKRTTHNATTTIASFQSVRTTNTIFTTTTVTITSCAIQAVNCPGEKQTVMELTRTLCPTAAASKPAKGICPAVNATTLPSLTSPVIATLTPTSQVRPPPGAPPANKTVPSLRGLSSTSKAVLPATTVNAGQLERNATLPAPTSVGTPVGETPASTATPVQVSAGERMSVFGRFAGMAMGLVVFVVLTL